MNKGLTLITLLAAVNAAAPETRNNQGTLWFQKFPNYSDNAAADFILTSTQGQVLVLDTIKRGGYQCIRKGQIYAFPQTLAAATPFAPITATATMTFYGADSDGASQGSTTAVKAVQTDNTSCETSINQIVTGNDITTDFGLQIILPTAAGATWTLGKVFYQGVNNLGTTWLWVLRTGRVTIGWNPDFLLASTYQRGGTTSASAAADFCTQQIVPLASLTADTTSSAKVGFLGKMKCTFLSYSDAAMGAPGMRLTVAFATAFNLQWAEWEEGALADVTQLVEANTTPLFLGTPAAQQWPNPLMSWQITGGTNALYDPSKVNGLAANQPMTEFDPKMNGYSATPGKLQWWPSSLGFGLTDATATMDYLQLEAEYVAYNGLKDSYNTAKSDYDTKKGLYNTALTDEKARLADLFKAMFEPVVKIPERPCQPTAMSGFAGLDFVKDSTAAIPSDANKANKVAVFNQNGGVKAVAASFKLGYQLPSNVAAWASGAGHTYGLLGQGTTNAATGTSPFQWMTADVAKKHYMMVSILPYNAGLTALTGANVISIQFTTAAFSTTLGSITKPTTPDGTSAPDSAGAKALAASVVALAAVASSLF